MKKFLIMILVILTLAVGFYFYYSSKVMKLVDFKMDDIKYIVITTLSQENMPSIYTDKETIESVYTVVRNKKTTVKNNGLNPSNPDELYLITFMKKDNKQVSFSIYNRDNNYFIEQSQNGIYDSSENEFLFIKGLVK